jgi:hypothetical protein
MNDSGQAMTEYAIVMVGLVTLVFLTGATMNALYDDGFFQLLRGFAMYSDAYDFVLSLPCP